MRNICFILLLVFSSCSGPDYETKYYRAISMDKRDTAFLKLLTSKDRFYGDYQVIYDDKSMDDGTIIGNIKNNLLIGKYSYRSRENVRSVIPIAFLKAGTTLKLGRGIAGTYMGFHVYLSESLTFNDSLFQFQPINSKELSSYKNSDN